MKKFKGFRNGSYPFPVLFADGSGDSSTSDDAGDDDANKGSDNNDANNADDGGQRSANEPFATFPTKSAFMARIQQASRSELKAMAEEMGFESVDEMTASAKKAKDIEAKNKSELEKEKERADSAEQKNEDITKRANQKLINAELKVFATQFKFVDPQDAIALAQRSEIQVDEEGIVTGAKEAVEALAKAKPHLTGKSKGAFGDSVNPGGDNDDTLSEEDQGKRLAEERRKAKEAPVASGVFNPWSE